MIETLKEFGLLIRKHRKKLDLTMDDIAAATGISKPYLSNIETARTPGPPSEEKLTALEKALQLPSGQLVDQAAWLRTPLSIRALFQQKDNTSAPALPRRSDGTLNLDVLLSSGKPRAKPLDFPPKLHDASVFPVRSLPLINRVAAGQPTEFTDLGYPVGIADAYVPMPELPPESSAEQLTQPYFALRVTGDSMEPEYHEGDLLILGAGPVQDGQDCLIRFDETKNFSTTFKRVYFGAEAAENQTIRLVPLNSQHSVQIVPREHISGLFPVLWKMTPVRRDLQTGSNVRIE